MNIKSFLPGVLTLAAGLFLGWLFFAGSGGNAATGAHDHAAEESSTIWTCSMHPQIRQQEFGLCPICAMDLIPLEGDAAADAPGKLQMTEEAVQAANIQTVMVEKGMPFREVRMPGKVQADESRLAQLTARVPGRIEKLHVNFTGQVVRRGEKLATVYSPELLTAQKELLEAVRMKEQSPAYLEAARSKLRHWDLTDEQITGIEQSGKVRGSFDILAPQGGTVLMRHVAEGDYVREGASLFAIADLSRVWVVFDAYENDLAWLREGMTLRFTVAGQAGNEYSGGIRFIDPVIDPATRVAGVRLEMPNPGNALKPEMFATGVVTSMLPGEREQLVIPRSAVLWTGTRSVVWVQDTESDEPLFEYREVKLGDEAGDSYVVLGGLAEGERVVANGVFSIDAAAQLQGKSSMMNPGGGAVSTGHDHGGSGRDSRPAASVSAPDAFRRQINALFAAYEGISKALVASDAAAATAAVAAAGKALGAVDAAGLSADNAVRWAELRAVMRKQLDALRATRDLNKQRASFEHLSDALYSAIKEFGHEGGTVYRQYCPMAFDDKGAYWLSSKKEIRNPYFGDAMLKCGLTKEELK